MRISNYNDRWHIESKISLSHKNIENSNLYWTFIKEVEVKLLAPKLDNNIIYHFMKPIRESYSKF